MSSGGLIISFVLSLFAMYSLVPIMLMLGGATFFNLSLLTSDVYAIVFGITIFGKVVRTQQKTKRESVCVID
jgi:solute carrier family 35 protein F1/2